jgi:predicted RNA polymerase sigma factor
MFVSCHPVLSPEARVALTLRVVGGLSSEEIARAFLVPVPTVQARITRAKKTIAAAGVPFELPPAGERRGRLGGVLSVLYVIFTEGSTATSGDRLLRPDVAYEAIRLTRTLAALQPDEPEVHGLLALCELTAARFPARTGPDGSPILLEDQDRRRWDFSAIRRGLAALAKASTRGLGPYGLQAAIAAAHASAPSVEATDWDRIVVLYEALGRVAPSPVVELNRAVAVAMASGPAQALAIVDELIALDRLPGSHLVPTVRGELLARLGWRPEARAELELAARRCANQRERSVLLRKAAALDCLSVSSSTGCWRRCGSGSSTARRRGWRRGRSCSRSGIRGSAGHHSGTCFRSLARPARRRCAARTGRPCRCTFRCACRPGWRRRHRPPLMTTAAAASYRWSRRTAACRCRARPGRP